MLKLVIEIESRPGPGANEFGAGVHVYGELPARHLITDAEGATLLGLGMAINAYLQARGCPNFNCLRALGIAGAERYDKRP